ncbi:winged helix-turn-helix domain-containing protein [Raoultella terrigena]|uniref:winged helix-turn-helix domain-containing protein n=1 Tax=Raoultella terrigena TaxID=577 RepID=UPI001EEE3071|nr:winged helix-turn-helix domain-containing protein [Raoultella terrigena]
MDRSDDIQSFIIGERAAFVPSRRVIVDKLNAKEIKLHLPASCCLEKLLRHQGEIVSQEELILCGWGSKRNAGVSHNTYYQCILHLRKSLAIIGFSDVIDTVPRHGLRFNNSVKVARVYADEDNKQQIDNSVKTEADGIESFVPNNIPGEMPELAVADGTPEVLNPSDGVLAEPAVYEIKPVSNSQNSGSNNGNKWLRHAGIALIAAMAGLMMLNHRPVAGGDAFSDYIKISSDGCTLFSANRTYSSSEIKAILGTLGLSCMNNEVVYFTASPMNTRLNLMYCLAYDKNNQNCRSLTVMKNMKVK